MPSPEPGFYGYGQPLAQMPAAYGGHEFYPTYGQPQQNMYSTAAPWQTYAAPHSKEKIERGRNLERDQEPAPEVRGRAGIFSIISYLLSRRKEGDEHEELVGKGYERDAKLYLEEYEKYIQQVGIQLPSIDIAFKNMRFTVKDKKSGQEKVLVLPLRPATFLRFPYPSPTAARSLDPGPVFFPCPLPPSPSLL